MRLRKEDVPILTEPKGNCVIGKLFKRRFLNVKLFKRLLRSVQYNFLGDIREGEIPDPIPNSEVKPLIADGTVRKSMVE